MIRPFKARRASSIAGNQSGKIIVKFFWWPLIVSLLLSIFLTFVVNVLF